MKLFRSLFAYLWMFPWFHGAVPGLCKLSSSLWGWLLFAFVEQTTLWSLVRWHSQCRRTLVYSFKFLPRLMSFARPPYGCFETECLFYLNNQFYVLSKSFTVFSKSKDVLQRDFGGRSNNKNNGLRSVTLLSTPCFSVLMSCTVELLLVNYQVLPDLNIYSRYWHDLTMIIWLLEGWAAQYVHPNK